MEGRHNLFGTVCVTDHSSQVNYIALMQAAASRSSERLFSVLPRDIILHILDILCKTPDMAIANSGLASFRLVNAGNTFATTNTATLVVFLYSADQFQSAIPYLSKLAAVTDISLSITIKLPKTPQSGSQSRLFLAPPYSRSAEIQLASLYMSEGIRQSLKRLEMIGRREALKTCVSSKNCTPGADFLLQGTDRTGGDKDEWCLDLRAVETLIIKYASVRLLDLSLCPNLRGLKLKNNPCLLAVGGCSALNHLHTAICGNNCSLTSLDMTSCDGLLKLKCEKNEKLLDLVLGCCTSLQYLKLHGNQCLVDADLSPCTSLQRLTCVNNSTLIRLQIPLCPHMTSVDCSSNRSLLHLNLSQQPALQRLECLNNSELVDCRLFECPALRYAHVSENVGLDVLDLTGCVSLERLQCCGNTRLLTLEAQHCRPLAYVECSHCSAMTELNLSHCFDLEQLSCSDNPALTSVDLSGCQQLRVLTVIGCLGLKVVDRSRCPNILFLTRGNPSQIVHMALESDTTVRECCGCVCFLIYVIFICFGVVPVVMCAYSVGYCLHKLLAFLTNDMGV